MLTIESLKAFGANTEEGLARCINNEEFYLRMANLVLNDGNFDKLRKAADAKDTAAMFEAVHALKGAVGNVSLTPIYEPVCALTELLRGKTGYVDPGTLVDDILAKFDEYKKLAE